MEIKFCKMCTSPIKKMFLLYKMEIIYVFLVCDLELKANQKKYVFD